MRFRRLADQPAGHPGRASGGPPVPLAVLRRYGRGHTGSGRLPVRSRAYGWRAHTARLEIYEDIVAAAAGVRIGSRSCLAENHHDEARILVQAGRRGAVTVVTRMAGRGVDIKLGGSGGAGEAGGSGRDEVADLGGLCVLGAERRQLARLDTHLRGRAGRQGDPGESKFFVALDDALMRSICRPRQVRWMRWTLKMGPSHNKRIRWALDRGQRNLQARNTASLIHESEYDAVVARQQEAIYADRETLLTLDVPRDHIYKLIDKVLDGYVTAAESLDDPGLWRALSDLYPCSLSPETVADAGRSFRSDLIDRLRTDARDAYARREAELGSENMSEFERRILLAVTDRHWRAHLEQMMELFDGIWLRGVAGRSPLAAYQREADKTYATMREAIAENAVGYLFNLDVTT